MGSVLATDFAGPLALGALGAFAVWLVVVGLFALVTRARLPDPGPATMELGEEPPALVNFLVHRYRVEREAAAATLLDLAARRHLEIDLVGEDDLVCRVRRDPPDSLTPYEAQVLGHLRGVAVDGVVPAAALTTGPEDESRRWWRRFEKSVVVDARARGLSRSRWAPWMLVVLFVLALAPTGLAGAAFAVAPDSNGRSSSTTDDLMGATFVALIGAFALMAIPKALGKERETPHGTEVTARWLGVRAFLDEHGQMEQHTAAGVAVWDRYLSYGAALGVSHEAVAGLPFGSESPRRAWSHEGGRWRLVRVRYPRRWPPGWGRNPWAAIGIGLLQAAAFGVIGWQIFKIGIDVSRSALDDAGGVLDWARNARMVPLLALGAVLVGLATLGVAWIAVRSVLLLAYGVGDLGPPVTLEGTVVRRRAAPRPNDRGPERTWLAIDDGRAERVRAVLVTGPVTITQGQRVRAVVTRHLGHVREMSALRAAAPKPRATWSPPATADRRPDGVNPS